MTLITDEISACVSYHNKQQELLLPRMISFEQIDYEGFRF